VLRATHIAGFFVDMKAIPPDRFSAADYAEALLHAQHLDDDPLAALAVELGVRDALPRAQVQLAAGLCVHSRTANPWAGRGN